MRLKRWKKNGEVELTFRFTERDIEQMDPMLFLKWRVLWQLNNSKLEYAEFIVDALKREAYTDDPLETLRRSFQQKVNQDREAQRRASQAYQDQFKQQQSYANSFNGDPFAGFGGAAQQPRGAPPRPDPAWVKILGIPKTSTKDQIKAKYRELAKKYHPDRPGGNATKFNEITKAYNEAML